LLRVKRIFQPRSQKNVAEDAFDAFQDDSNSVEAHSTKM
jgi:hypothetical protein